MVVGILKTAAGLLLLSVIFSLPFICLYLTYELVWPKVSPYVPTVVSKE